MRNLPSPFSWLCSVPSWSFPLRLPKTLNKREAQSLHQGSAEPYVVSDPRTGHAAVEKLSVSPTDSTPPLDKLYGERKATAQPFLQSLFPRGHGNTPVSNRAHRVAASSASLCCGVSISSPVSFKYMLYIQNNSDMLSPCASSSLISGPEAENSK